MGDPNPETKTTRSRKKSTGGAKRKRPDDEDIPCPKKMTPDSDDENDPTFKRIRKYLSTIHRTEVQADTDKAIGKISSKLNATQAELTQHKAEMQQELASIKASIGGMGQHASTIAPQAGSSYASAAACAPSTSTISHQSNKSRMYWQCRRCAKIHNIKGSSDDELWRNLQQFFSYKNEGPLS